MAYRIRVPGHYFVLALWAGTTGVPVRNGWATRRGPRRRASDHPECCYRWAERAQGDVHGHQSARGLRWLEPEFAGCRCKPSLYRRLGTWLAWDLHGIGGTWLGWNDWRWAASYHGRLPIIAATRSAITESNR